jgi:pimeloyl-ACP methyl ester carboxylesterase
MTSEAAVARAADASASPGSDMVGVSEPVAYDIAGPADAPAIVFIHGTRLTRKAWTAQMDALSDEFRTIAIDLPGHGVLADVPFSLTDATDRLAAIIDREAGGRAIVTGLSLGGFVAMDLASRFPERVAGLVLAGATVEPTGLGRLGIQFLAWFLATFDGRALNAFNGWFFRFRFPRSIADPIVTAGFFSRGGAAALRSIVGQAFRPRLASYPGRTLIIEGTLDLPLRMGERSFLLATQHGRIVRLAGATHLSNLDRPAAFSDAVRRFARSLGPTA